MTNEGERDQTGFEHWLHQQARSLPQPEVSSEFLAGQRRGIYRRLEDPRRTATPLRWALSFAMLLLLLGGGVTFERRQKSPAPISDEQLFSDLTAMDQRAEPKAIQPIHSLFEE